MAVSSISKSVAWQLVGKFFLQGVAFFTTPIFTRVLSPSDYGYTALYISWLAIFGLIIGLQVNGSIGNARIEYGEDKLPKYLSSIMSVSLLSFITILGIVLIFNKFFASFMGLSTHIVIILVVHAFCSFVINFEVSRLDNLKKVEKSTLLSLSQVLVSTFFSMILVLISKENKAYAKIYGQAIPCIVLGIVLCWLIYRRGKTFWNKDYIKFCLSLTLPLIMHGVGHLIFNQSDRLMLDRMHGAVSLSIYSVTSALCSVLSIIFGALNVSWVPFYYDYKRKGDTLDIIAHSKRYIKFYTIISIGFIVLSYDVYKIMAPSEYYDGMKIIPFLVLSNFFSFLYLFPVNYEFYRKKTKLIPLSTFIAAFINIVINWFLIPEYGITGAAIGTLVAHVLLYILHEMVARIIGRDDYEYKRMIGIFFVSAFIMICICAFFYFFPTIHFCLRWGVAIILGVYIIRDLLKYRSVF